MNIRRIIREILSENSEITDTIQMYIDIIDDMPKDNSKRDVYIKTLKDKYDYIYGEPTDDLFIETANLNDIKNKKDFRSFDNYVKYAKKIFHIRGLGKIQPNHIDGRVSSSQAMEIGDKINLKINTKEYGGVGNYASHDFNDTITMPNIVDINVFIHEVGHHFDYHYSKEYNGFAKTITYASSPYDIGRNGEVFAENFLHYFIAPNWLKKHLPDVFFELDKKIPTSYKNIINFLIKNREK